jgi:hypothetical protein
MAESSAGDFTVGKIQKTRRQRVAKMYGQQKRNIIHMSSTAYEQDHSAAAPPSSVMNPRLLIRSPRLRGRLASVGFKAERPVGPHDGLMGRNVRAEIRPRFTFNERRGGATLSRSQVETAHQGHLPA